MTVPRLACALAFLFLTAALPAQDKNGGQGEAKPITINIQEYKYIKEGDTEQKPVVVKVGQTVIWKNSDEVKHTATSKTEKDGKPLFDTGKIAADKTAKIIFDQKLFAAFGGKAGGEVTVEYYCIPHKPNMKSSIIFQAADKTN